jgi:hypothetical protein
MHAPLCAKSWQFSHSRVLCIWRREGLKVPRKQPRRSRLWFNNSLRIRAKEALEVAAELMVEHGPAQAHPLRQRPEDDG